MAYLTSLNFTSHRLRFVPIIYFSPRISTFLQGDVLWCYTVLPKVGAVYKRTGTLTLGAPVCDVRFELRTQENK